MGVGMHSAQFVRRKVGSERRLEYTVIGDTTNTASRIQESLQDPPADLVHVDSFTVRGRHARIRLWSLEGVSDKPGGPKEEAASAGTGTA